MSTWHSSRIPLTSSGVSMTVSFLSTEDTSEWARVRRVEYGCCWRSAVYCCSASKVRTDWYELMGALRRADKLAMV